MRAQPIVFRPVSRLAIHHGDIHGKTMGGSGTNRCNSASAFLADLRWLICEGW